MKYSTLSLWLLWFAVLILAIFAAVAHAGERPEPVGYLPVILVYEGGTYTGAVNLDPQESMRECKEHLAKAVLGSAEDPNAPKGSTYIGACVPIPPAPGGDAT